MQTYTPTYLKTWPENSLKFHVDAQLSSIQIRRIRQLRIGDLHIYADTFAEAQP
jgi:hypothetical protein